MSSLIDALYHAKHNPFKYGSFIASFYAELHDVESNLLLSPLIIPLCTHPALSRKLKHLKFGARKASTIWTVFSGNTQLHDLQQRLDDFRKLTDQSLQYCLINDWIEIDTENLLVTADPTGDVPFLSHKSAANLGKLFSDLSAIEIYSLLEVVPK